MKKETKEILYFSKEDVPNLNKALSIVLERKMISNTSIYIAVNGEVHIDSTRSDVLFSFGMEFNKLQQY